VIGRFDLRALEAVLAAHPRRPGRRALAAALARDLPLTLSDLRAAFEADRARDQALTAAGYVVLRFTHRQVADTPQDVVAKLTALLVG
jgi:hypothetical protein